MPGVISPCDLWFGAAEGEALREEGNHVFLKSRLDSADVSAVVGLERVLDAVERQPGVQLFNRGHRLINRGG
jgi:hypothetical protein